MNKQKNKEKRIALFEVILLVLGMFAFACILGNSFEVVSANGDCVGDIGKVDFDKSCDEVGSFACGTNVHGQEIVFKCVDNGNLGNYGGEYQNSWYSNLNTPCDNGCENCQCVSEEQEEETLADGKNEDESSQKDPGYNQLIGGMEAVGGAVSAGDTVKDWFAQEGGKAGTSTGTTETTLSQYGNGVIPDGNANYATSTTIEEASSSTSSVVKGTSNNQGTESVSLFKNGWQAFGKVLTVYASAFAAAYGYVMIFKMAGAGKRNLGALSSAAWITALSVGTAVSALMLSGVITTGAAATAATSGATTAFMSAAIGSATVPGVGWIAAIIVIIAMAVYTLASYQTYSQDVFTYMVSLWQPSTGGQNCEDCNNLRYGCSEYQCHSFGQACEIVNKGTEDEKCVWINPNDVLPPSITPMPSVLKDDFKYIPINGVTPGEKGAKIVYSPDNKGCIPPFTNLMLGVNTSEPAECRLDLNESLSFDEMSGYFVQGSSKVYNHTLLLPGSTMPSQSALEDANWSIQEGREHRFYIKCKDANGNQNPINFLLEFCVQEGPDLTAPVIESTTYSNETGQAIFVQHNETTIPLEVYTNEPADCRWDFIDFEYEQMNYNMTDCSQNINDFLHPITFTYGCRTNLTGMNSNQDTTYYIKCKDQPWEQEDNRNANTDPYTLTLKGTQPLQIDNITINNMPNQSTIFDSTDLIKATLKVKTSAGANEGNARCQYSVNGKYYDFYNNGTFEYDYINTQDLWLPEDQYYYPIKCYDEGGNSVYSGVEFTIETDLESPIIVRAFHEDESFRLITNEKAKCVYSTISETGCNYEFKDGTPINVLDGINHFLDWSTESNLYIKCEDIFGNQPIPQDSCTITLRGSEQYS